MSNGFSKNVNLTNDIYTACAMCNHKVRNLM